jgi:hypothetical protein
VSADDPPVVRPGEDTARGGDPSPDDDTDLGWVGWVLVVAVVLAVLVIPGVIYLWPAGGSVLGAHYRTAMLVLPMAPAVLLGIVAVWSMKNRR